MAMSTFQTVTLMTCLVLCVALLLPKMLLSGGRKDAAERPQGSGHLPPMTHRHIAAEAPGGLSRPHNPDAVTRAKGAGMGAGVGGKSNLAGQIIPVYGFGILVYILYILFKITSKGNNKPSEGRCPSVRSENMKRKITDFELDQLQEKLRETEMVMEDIVSSAHHSPGRTKGVTADQEESLLQQLTEITRAMREGKLVDNTAPEKKNQDGWEDYPPEPEQHWEHSHCCCRHHRSGCSPQTETQPERTRTEEAGAEDLPDDIRGGVEMNADVTEDDEGPDSESGVREHGETGGGLNPGVPEEDLAGVLKELEISLRMTSIMEQEKMAALSRTTETGAPCGVVRRRSKRRKAKKASC
ncbi:protein RIC-3b [Brachionichthys hirsutus]|uniref:protein RIC-3b n=1 Tax=Brachionichthys hirsutus TaxID=412623 RepID=UPI003604A26C